MRRLIPILLLVTTTFAASVLWWRADRERRVASARVTQLEAALKNQPVPIVVPEVTEEEPGEASPATTAKTPRMPAGTDVAPYLRMIEELREQIREQAKELSAARDAAARAEAQTANVAAEGQKRQAQIEELQEDLKSVRRLADAVQVELKAKSERLVKAETAEKVMSERLARAEGSVAKVAQVSKEIEDLNRRREASITTLVRRYREVNDLYRSFALNAQTRETPGSGLQAGDLSRIQSAVQQAEEDLRQLQALNARMTQLAQGK